MPFIARWPGTIPNGSKSDETVLTIDMFPTFMEVTNTKQPRDLQLDGQSIVSHLFVNKALPDRSVCWKIDDERAIRKGKWKLCMIGNNDPELFDLSNDIGETSNLAVDYPDLVEQLTAEYIAWEKDVTANYE